MYAYVASRPGQQRDYYDDGEYDTLTKEYVNKTVSRPHEIAYWRKHPNLHGWMHRLWESKGNSGEFNGDELELSWEDLESLEEAINNNELPGTSGFFFGNNADDHYKEKDLEFIKTAKAEIFVGLRVFYNSSW